MKASSVATQAKHQWPPATRLMLAMLWAIALISIVMILAARQPWLGLTLSWDDGRQAAVVMSSQGRASTSRPAPN